MYKHITLIILASFSLAYISGCTPTQQDTEGTQQPENIKPPENNSRPDKSEPNEITVQNIQNIIPEPDYSQTVINEPNKTQNTKTEPNEPNEPLITKIEPNEPNGVNLSPKVTFHDKCAYILKTYVDRLGMVDYKALKRKRNELGKLINEFADLDPNEYKSWPNEDKIAFWINAYNIQMLNIIIENYPIESDAWTRFFYWPPDSVRYINRKVGGIEKQKFEIMNEVFTLNEIEERFLYKQFNEPKAFFALFHGGLSGPSLLNKPYYGKTLYKQLEKQIKKTLSDPEGFKINPEKQTVSLHATLQSTWYGKYFVDIYKTDARFKDQIPAVRAVLNFLTNYLAEQQISYLELQNYSVRFPNYNWSLNERK